MFRGHTAHHQELKTALAASGFAYVKGCWTMSLLDAVSVQQTQRPTGPAGERPQAAHLLRSWVRIPPGAWIFVRCECRVLSGRGLCYELITRPEESYRLWCVVVCDLETSRIGAPCIYDIRSLRVNGS